MLWKGVTLFTDGFVVDAAVLSIHLWCRLLNNSLVLLYCVTDPGVINSFINPLPTVASYRQSVTRMLLWEVKDTESPQHAGDSTASSCYNIRSTGATAEAVSSNRGEIIVNGPVNHKKDRSFCRYNAYCCFCLPVRYFCLPASGKLRHVYNSLIS